MDIEYKNPTIYLVCGKAKHGKDTFSNYLKGIYEKHNEKAIITQYSKYIKYYAREMTGWDLSEETKPRDLLQKLGTDVIRMELKKEEMFINRMIDDIEIFSMFYNAIIISDVRFEKEILHITRKFNNAVVIHIDRINFDNGLTEEQKKHPTETGLDNFSDYDYKIKNTTLEKLKKDALKIYNKESKEK